MLSERIPRCLLERSENPALRGGGPPEAVAMLTDYIDAAMRHAHYEILPDDEGYFGKIERFQGVWANADTLEDCRKELQEVLEEWLIIGANYVSR